MKDCNLESILTDSQMAYILLANILLLIQLNVECSWIWIEVPTPVQAWITLRLPVPFPKLKTGESFVQVPMPPTIHTGFIGWLTSGTRLEVISHDGDRPGMAGPFPIPVRLYIFCLIVLYPKVLMDFLIRVFITLLLLLALIVITVIVWSMCNSWSCGLWGICRY